MTLLMSCIGYARAQVELTVHDNTAQTNTVPAYIFYWDDFTRSQVVFPADDLTDMAGGATITAMTFYTDQTAAYTSASTADVYLMEVDYTSISAFEPKANGQIVYQGTFTINADGTLTIEFTDPYIYQGGNLLIGIENTTDAGYKNIKFYGETITGASVAGYNSSSLDDVAASQKNFIPKTTFTYTPGSEGPTCRRPTGLTVSNVTLDSAVLSWTSDADNFDIEVNETIVAEGVSGNSYTLTGLVNASVYNVRVRTNCSDGDVSNWTNPVSFVTEICAPEDQCLINITLTDSYKDGWGGGKLDVVDVETEKVLGTYTLATGGESSYTLSVCNGREIKFVYTTGSFATENGWLITDINDEVIAEHEGCNNGCQVASGIIATYLVDCSVAAAQKPTELAVSGITFNSAQLSWTQAGEATQWEICLNADEENVIAADSNPFTLTDLTPETSYTAKVRAVVGEEKSNWSDAVSFTTLEQFQRPTDVTANNVTTNSADVSWTGEADSYNLRYRTISEGEVVLSEDFEGSSDLPDGWTTIDADGDGYGWFIFTSETGVDGAGNPTVFDASCATSASYYNTALTPDNWLVSPQIDLLGTLRLWVRAQDPDWTAEKFAIYLSTTGKNVGDFTNVLVAESTATGVYVEYTADLNAYLGQKGYIAIRHFDCTDMFRLNVDNITVTGIGETGEWITVNDANSPYSLTGLNDDSSYQVEVQAIYADGTSAWVGTGFVTPSSNPLPTNVTVDAQHTTATISWQGVNDSYKVKYRKAASQEKIFFEDFENGLPDTWTTIDNDGDGNNWYGGSTGTDDSGNPTGFGSGLVTSASYYNNALTPDNWLITPQIDLQGTLSVWLRAQDPDWAQEHFAIYVTTTGNTVDDFTRGGTAVVPETVATGVLTEYTYDLSAYEGQKGYIAIRHFNCTDMFRLNVDNFGIYGDDIPAGEWIEIATEDTSVELTGLEMGTEYEYTIIGIIDGVENAGTPIATFTTLTENDKFFITEGNWDVAENWLPAGVPTATCNLTIQADATIPAGVIALANKVTIDGGSITIKDGGELKQNSNELVVTFEKDIKGYTGTRDGYYLIASPIVGTTSSEEVENLLSNDYDYFRFLANQTNEWRSFGMSIFDMQLPNNIEFANNTVGNGYLYASKEDKTLKFTGSIYPVMNAALNITYDGSATYSFNDWRLVGNPFSYSVYMFNVVEENIDYDSEFYKLNASGDAFEMYPVFVKLAPGEAAFVKVTQTENLYVYSTNPFADEPSTEGIVGDAPFLPRHGLNAYVDADLIKLADDGDNTEKIVANAQANFMLDGRTLYKDGKWNTLTLPFNVVLANSELADATAKTLSEATVDGTSITLTFGDAVESLVAGTPYIIKWESGEDNIVNPVFDSYGLGATARIITATEGQTVEKADGNVKFIGYYNPVNITAADDDIYYLTADNTLKYTGKDRTLKAFRAYFQFAESEGARTFILDFGEGGTATMIGNLPAEMFGQGDWYTPSGIKVGDSLPAKKGIYINNGKKVVIK